MWAFNSVPPVDLPLIIRFQRGLINLAELPAIRKLKTTSVVV
jgi:hypothetical protein